MHGKRRVFPMPQLIGLPGRSGHPGQDLPVNPPESNSN